MIKRNRLQDSLAPRFDGPYSVIGRNGPSVTLRSTSQDKSVHLNNCKIYAGNEPAVVQIGRASEPDNDDRSSDEERTMSGDSPDILCEHYRDTRNGRRKAR